jgi:hypothetical protein
VNNYQLLATGNWKLATALSPSIRYTLYEIRSTKDYVRNYKLFLQNEPKFRKSQMNVNEVLTRDYEQKDTWSIGKNEPKTNPNEPKTNPIKANKMPKQTQTNPISEPI